MLCFFPLMGRLAGFRTRVGVGLPDSPSWSRTTRCLTSSTSPVFEGGKLERAVADADQPVHGDANPLHRAADLAVLALADADRQPCIRPLLAVKGDDHRLVIHAFNGDACAQFVQLGFADRSVDAHAVAAQPAGAWQFQLALHLAVVGQQKQILRS